jgi:hypothetical protein
MAPNTGTNGIRASTILKKNNPGKNLVGHYGMPSNKTSAAKGVN